MKNIILGSIICFSSVLAFGSEKENGLDLTRGERKRYRPSDLIKLETIRNLNFYRRPPLNDGQVNDDKYKKMGKKSSIKINKHGENKGAIFFEYRYQCDRGFNDRVIKVIKELESNENQMEITDYLK